MTHYVFFYIDQPMRKNLTLFAKHFEKLHSGMTI
jgi:hypothetical protein